MVFANSQTEDRNPARSEELYDFESKGEIPELINLHSVLSFFFDFSLSIFD